MKAIKAIGLWFSTAICLIISGGIFFPPDSEGIVNIPAWYVNIIIFLPLVVVFIYLATRSQSWFVSNDFSRSFDQHRKDSPHVTSHKPKTKDIRATEYYQGFRKETGVNDRFTFCPGASLAPTKPYRIVDPKSKKALLAALDSEYVVLDVETTGFNRDSDEIIEVALIRCHPDGTKEYYSSLINPLIDIPSTSYVIHHISNEMVKYAPTMADKKDEIAGFISDLPLVSHYAPFDGDFITKYIDPPAHSDAFIFYDTVDLSRRAFPNLQNHKLATLIREFNLMDGHIQTHRAMDDAKCTQRLFELCIYALMDKKEAELAAQREKRKGSAKNA